MGKIEEMLASGRAPGLIVRGSYARQAMAAVNPSPDAISNEARVRMDEKNFAAGAKMAAEFSGRRSRKDGELRHIGRSSLAEVCERFKSDQDDVHVDRKKFLKDTGALFPHVKL